MSALQTVRRALRRRPAPVVPAPRDPLLITLDLRPVRDAAERMVASFRRAAESLRSTRLELDLAHDDALDTVRRAVASTEWQLRLDVNRGRAEAADIVDERLAQFRRDLGLPPTPRDARRQRERAVRRAHARSLS